MKTINFIKIDKNLIKTKDIFFQNRYFSNTIFKKYYFEQYQLGYLSLIHRLNSAMEQYEDLNYSIKCELQLINRETNNIVTIGNKLNNILKIIENRNFFTQKIIGEGIIANNFNKASLNHIEKIYKENIEEKSIHNTNVIQRVERLKYLKVDNLNLSNLNNLSSRRSSFSKTEVISKSVNELIGGITNEKYFKNITNINTVSIKLKVKSSDAEGSKNGKDIVSLNLNMKNSNGNQKQFNNNFVSLYKLENMNLIKNLIYKHENRDINYNSENEAEHNLGTVRIKNIVTVNRMKKLLKYVEANKDTINTELSFLNGTKIEKIYKENIDEKSIDNTNVIQRIENLKYLRVDNLTLSNLNNLSISKLNNNQKQFSNRLISLYKSKSLSLIKNLIYKYENKAINYNNEVEHNVGIAKFNVNSDNFKSIVTVNGMKKLLKYIEVNKNVGNTELNFLNGTKIEKIYKENIDEKNIQKIYKGNIEEKSIDNANVIQRMENLKYLKVDNLNLSNLNNLSISSLNYLSSRRLNFSKTKVISKQINELISGITNEKHLKNITNINTVSMNLKVKSSDDEGSKNGKNIVSINFNMKNSKDNQKQFNNKFVSLYKLENMNLIKNLIYKHENIDINYNSENEAEHNLETVRLKNIVTVNSMKKLLKYVEANKDTINTELSFLNGTKIEKIYKENIDEKIYKGNIEEKSIDNTNVIQRIESLKYLRVDNLTLSNLNNLSISKLNNNQKQFSNKLISLYKSKSLSLIKNLIYKYENKAINYNNEAEHNIDTVKFNANSTKFKNIVTVNSMKKLLKYIEANKNTVNTELNFLDGTRIEKIYKENIDEKNIQKIYKRNINEKKIEKMGKENIEEKSRDNANVIQRIGNLKYLKINNLSLSGLKDLNISNLNNSQNQCNNKLINLYRLENIELIKNLMHKHEKKDVKYGDKAEFKINSAKFKNIVTVNEMKKLLNYIEATKNVVNTELNFLDEAKIEKIYKGNIDEKKVQKIYKGNIEEKSIDNINITQKIDNLKYLKIDNLNLSNLNDLNISSLDNSQKQFNNKIISLYKSKNLSLIKNLVYKHEKKSINYNNEAEHNINTVKFNANSTKFKNIVTVNSMKKLLKYIEANKNTVNTELNFLDGTRIEKIYKENIDEKNIQKIYKGNINEKKIEKMLKENIEEKSIDNANVIQRIGNLKYLKIDNLSLSNLNDLSISSLNYLNAKRLNLSKTEVINKRINDNQKQFNNKSINLYKLENTGLIRNLIYKHEKKAINYSDEFVKNMHTIGGNNSSMQYKNYNNPYSELNNLVFKAKYIDDSAKLNDAIKKIENEQIELRKLVQEEISQIKIKGFSQINITNLSEKVYRNIENKLKFEKQRRGMG